MSQLTLCSQCQKPLDSAGQCYMCDAPAPRASQLVAQAEALFVSYLAARIVHARHRLKAMQRELLGDPRDRARGEAVKRAQEEVQRLQNQLVAQTRESQRAQRAVEQARFLTDQQASVIEAPTAPHATERKCPRCGGGLPGAVNHCRCGYVIETPLDAGPALFTAAGDTVMSKSDKGK